MDRHYIYIAIAIMIGCIVLYLVVPDTTTAPSELPPEETPILPSDPVRDPGGPAAPPAPAPNFSQAEQVGFTFMENVVRITPPFPDPSAADALFNALSRRAQETVSSNTISSDMAQFIGVQDMPDQAISVEDLQVVSDTEAVLTIGMNYSTSGQVLRDVALIYEDNGWKVDAVRVPDGSPKPGFETLPPEQVSTSSNPCVPAGCSSTLCVDADTAGDIMSTCEWLPEYACYQTATCEQQADGACGWTETPELTNCVENAAQQPQAL